MLNQPLVSIVTPAYNCSKTILETFDSIRRQTYKNWEWIVIEDHSADETLAILNELRSNNKNIILLRTQERSGTAIARNMGIEKANGRFISFLDADDLWKPNKLEIQIDYMLESSLPFTYSNYDVLFSNGKIKAFVPKKNYADYKSLLRRNDIGCLTVVFDSYKIKNVKMPVDALKREDYATWLDITKNGIVASKINENLAIYRLGNESLTSNKKKMIRYHYRIYRNHEKFSVIKSIYYLVIFSLNKLFNKYR